MAKDVLDEMIARRGKGFTRKVERAVAQREFDRKAQRDRKKNGPWVPYSRIHGIARLG